MNSDKDHMLLALIVAAVLGIAICIGTVMCFEQVPGDPRITQ